MKYSDWYKDLAVRSQKINLPVSLIRRVGESMGLRVEKPLDSQHFQMGDENVNFSLWHIDSMEVFFEQVEEETGVREVVNIGFTYSSHSGSFVEWEEKNRFWEMVKEEAKKMLPDSGKECLFPYPEQVVTLPIPEWVGVILNTQDVYSNSATLEPLRMFASEAKKAIKTFNERLKVWEDSLLTKIVKP